jgi:hypothetical protein
MAASLHGPHPLRYTIPMLVGATVALVLFGLGNDSILWAKWSSWLPLGKWPIYGDLHITLVHLSQAAEGLDPLGDPDSEFAYPRAVLALRHLGVQNIPWGWIGLMQNFAVVAVVTWVLRPRTLTAAIATGLLFLAPAMILGFERANLDFALFILCAAAALWWARGYSARDRLAPAASLVLGAILKLYPVFVIATAAVVETGKRRLVWLAGAAVVLATWLLHWADFALIGPKLAVTSWGSWGCLVFFIRLERYLGLDRDAYVWLADARWPLIALITYAVLAAAALVVGRRLMSHFAAVAWRPRECACFWVGAAICCGSFAGANFAYRWIFVLFTVPLLLQAARAPAGVVAWWARLTLCALVVSLFAPMNPYRGTFLLVQAANWSCILLLVTGAAALLTTAYPRVRTDSRRPQSAPATSNPETVPAGGRL